MKIGVPATRRNVTVPALPRRLRHVLAPLPPAALAANVAAAMKTGHGVGTAVALVMETCAHGAPATVRSTVRAA